MTTKHLCYKSSLVDGLSHVAACIKFGTGGASPGEQKRCAAGRQASSET